MAPPVMLTIKLKTWKPLSNLLSAYSGGPLYEAFDVVELYCFSNLNWLTVFGDVLLFELASGWFSLFEGEISIMHVA